MAITRAQFRKRAKQLKKEVARLIDERIEKAINSGALPLEKYGDDFILPKAFMSAMGHEIAFQFKPHDKEAQKVAENLKHFL